VATSPVRNNGEDVGDAINRVRTEIGLARNQLRSVNLAALPKSLLKARAKTYVRELADRGRPRVSGDRGEFTIAFPQAETFSISNLDRLIALLAWLNPDGMTKRIEAEIDALPKAETALSPTERNERAASLIAEIESLEHQEEALIGMALAQGRDVMRRTDADPRAILGVAVKAKRIRAA
jgi:hypothetical protein